MADQPKMLAWAVSLTFEGGPTVLDTVIAPSTEGATATVAVRAVQQLGITRPLASYAITPISLEWLELAARAMKGMLPEGGNAQVFSLVPKAEPDPEATHDFEPFVHAAGHQARKCRNCGMVSNLDDKISVTCSAVQHLRFGPNFPPVA